MIRGFVRVIKIHLVRVRLRRRFEHFDFVAFRRRIDVPIPPQKRALIKHSHVAIVKSSWFLFRVSASTISLKHSPGSVNVSALSTYTRSHDAMPPIKAHLEFPFVFPIYPFDWFVVPRVVRAFLVVQVPLVFRRPFGKRSDVEQIVSFQRRNDGVARVRVGLLRIFRAGCASSADSRQKLLLLLQADVLATSSKSFRRNIKGKKTHATANTTIKTRVFLSSSSSSPKGQRPECHHHHLSFSSEIYSSSLPRTPSKALLLLPSSSTSRRRRRRPMSFCARGGGKHHLVSSRVLCLQQTARRIFLLWTSRVLPTTHAAFERDCF